MIEMKTYIITSYGHRYKVFLEIGKYRNDRLAIELIDVRDGPFAVLTVNLVNEQCPKNCAYLDTNNFPQGEEFVKKHKLGKPTGYYGRSGYCMYPLYKFDMAALKGKAEREPAPFGL